MFLPWCRQCLRSLAACQACLLVLQAVACAPLASFARRLPHSPLPSHLQSVTSLFRRLPRHFVLRRISSSSSLRLFQPRCRPATPIVSNHHRRLPSRPIRNPFSASRDATRLSETRPACTERLAQNFNPFAYTSLNDDRRDFITAPPAVPVSGLVANARLWNHFGRNPATASIYSIIAFAQSLFRHRIFCACTTRVIITFERCSAVPFICGSSEPVFPDLRQLCDRTSCASAANHCDLRRPPLHHANTVAFLSRQRSLTCENQHPAVRQLMHLTRGR